MPAKEEWQIWCGIAKRVSQIAASGSAVERFAANLSNTHVDPPLTWSRNCDLEAALHDIEEHAKRVIDLVSGLRQQFCGVSIYEESAMAVRAKVTCDKIEGNAVQFRTVYETDETKAKDPENVRFTQATPWGSILLGIDNPAALSQFEVGKDYYVDFTPAGK